MNLRPLNILGLQSCLFESSFYHWDLALVFWIFLHDLFQDGFPGLPLSSQGLQISAVWLQVVLFGYRSGECQSFPHRTLVFEVGAVVCHSSSIYSWLSVFHRKGLKHLMLREFSIEKFVIFIYLAFTSLELTTFYFNFIYWKIFHTIYLDHASSLQVLPIQVHGKVTS